MEIVIVGNENTGWYKRCRKYLDETDAEFEKAKKIVEKYGVDINNVAIDYDTLYLKHGEKYSDEVVKMFKTSPLYSRNGVFDIIKKNSKIGKEFSKIGVSKPRKPMVGFELFNGIPIRSAQFIFNKKIYIRIESEKDIDIPAGFEQVKLSEFYSMLENIKEDESLHLENI